MAVTYLQVEFREKDLVKSLGARWDGGSKRWFVPSHLDVAAFARWLPDDASVSSTAALPATGQRPAIGLSQLLQRVAQAVNQVTIQAEWVKAEISECRATKNGHVHLDLIELDADKNLLGKANAKLFKQQADFVLDKFLAATHSELASGMKVLLLVRVQFHIQFGFALIIEDIDPTYTLGDVAAKLNHIRDVLRQENLIDCNRQLATPREFCRLAVLSPHAAAGLGDFRQEADLLAHYGLCQFQYYHSQFQGEQASVELQQALRHIVHDHQRDAFDALVIIRGGGAVIDLAWLNDLEVARHICAAPMPVFSGIGHERDNTIIDEIANKRFDTPSKVIAHVLSAIVHNAQQASSDTAFIAKQVRHTVAQWAQQTEHCHKAIQTGVQQSFALAYRDTHHLYQQIIVNATHSIDTLLVTVRHSHEHIATLCQHGLQQAQRSIHLWQESIVQTCQQRVQTLRSQVADYRQQIYENIQQACYYYQAAVKENLLHVVSLGPEATLQRGFALVSGSDGHLISRVAEARASHTLKIRFQDGFITVQPKGSS